MPITAQQSCVQPRGDLLFSILPRLGSSTPLISSCKEEVSDNSSCKEEVSDKHTSLLARPSVYHSEVGLCALQDPSSAPALLHTCIQTWQALDPLSILVLAPRHLCSKANPPMKQSLPFFCRTGKSISNKGH